MFKFLRKTSLYILAVPALFFGLGLVSNQVVLWANRDKFPVMWSDYKVAEYELSLEQTAAQVDKSGEPTDKAEDAQLALVALKDEGFIDQVHVVMTSKTHLNFLADVFDLKEATYSIGDFLLMLSDWLMVFAPFLFVFDVVRKLQKD